MVEVNTFTKILDEIGEDERTLTISLEDIDPRTRPGWETRIRMAGERIQNNRKLFSEELKRAAFTIFTDGPKDKTQEFAYNAQTEGGALTVDSQALYKRLTTEVYPSMGNSKEMTSHQVGMLMNSLAKVCTELNIIGYPPLKQLVYTHAETLAEATEIVKDLIVRSMGHEMNKIYIEHLAAKYAIDEKFQNPVAPVVIMNTSADERAALGPTLFNGRFLTVDLEKDGYDKNTVVKTFNTIRKTLKELKNSN